MRRKQKRNVFRKSFAKSVKKRKKLSSRRSKVENKLTRQSNLS